MERKKKLYRLLNSFLLLCCLTSCSSLYFFPQKELVRTPRDIGVEYETIQMSAKDGTKLSAWLLKTADKKPKGVIYFLHGNAENISTHLASVYWLPEAGYDVLMLDYRGFGASQGKATLPEVFEDIDAGFLWLKNHYNDDMPIIFLGQSIGASLGVFWLADEGRADEIAAVVLDAPFARYPSMVRHILQSNWLTWLFAWPVSWGFSSQYDPIKQVENFPSVPLLFFNSEQDAIVPFEFSEKLYWALPQPKEKVTHQHSHIATFGIKENRHYLLDFLAKN